MGMTPATPELIGGLIEVPELSACLTLNKGDFIRAGARGATYLAFRKAIQEAVSRQLATWGDAPSSSAEAPPREVRPLQRDLTHMLEDLAADFPLLASLVEQRAGGQKKLPLGGNGDAQAARSFMAASVIQRAEDVTQNGHAASLEANDCEDSTETIEEAQAAPAASALRLPARGGSRRPAHYGLDIEFEDRAEDAEIGRLVDSTVWVNRAHPAYRRALASRSIGYHIALAVAMALAPLAVEAVNEHRFVTAFLSCWGAVVDKPGARSRARE